MSIKERLSKLEQQYGGITVLMVVEDGKTYTEEQRQAARVAGEAEAARTGRDLVSVDLAVYGHDK